MRIDDDERIYLWWDGTVTADPTDATIVLQVKDSSGTEVDGSPFAMEFVGDASTPVFSGSTWTLTARTAVKFCGSAFEGDAEDVQTGAGTFRAQVLMTTTDGQTVAASTQRLSVE